MSLPTDRGCTTIPTAAGKVHLEIHAKPVASGAPQVAVSSKSDAALIDDSPVGAAFSVDAQARRASIHSLDVSCKDGAQPIRVSPPAATPRPGQRRLPGPVQTQ